MGLIVVEDEHVKIRHIITKEDGSMTTVVEAYRPRIDSLAEWHRKVCYTIDDTMQKGFGLPSIGITAIHGPQE